jgi:hypothetical protein
MEFIKKNYEKIILIAVLIGLVGVLVGMWFVIMADRQKMEDFNSQIIHGKPVLLPPLDMSNQDAILGRVKEPYQLDFSETNKLFNPVQWRKTADGNLIKLPTGRELGPGAAVISKITPLYFSISLDSVETNLTTPRYKISVEHQASSLPYQRRPQAKFAAKGEGVSGFFKVADVKGAPEDPSELELQLPDGKTVAVGKDKPFRVVEGYSADFKYDPPGIPPAERVNATGLRVGDPLNFGGDQYNIIAIEQNEVVLLAQSNQKKFVLPYSQ